MPILMVMGTILFCLYVCCFSQGIYLDRITLPDRFSISVYASDIADARSMALGPKGVLFVGNRQNDKVWAIEDTNGDRSADRKTVIASGLTNPNGVAFFGNDLYVAERSRILCYRNIESRIASPPAPEVIFNNLPGDAQHGWKYIAFGPDGYLYVPVGAPCNVCLEEDPRYASITRMKPDGTDFSIYANGVRNTVGFDWHPVTRELWFTDNGRDNMGDDLPPDELNRATAAGLHFGFPFCHGGDTPDPEFGTQRLCGEFTAPALKLGAHVAALGMKFYSGSMFPPEYRNRIFIAEHGSWNRSKKTGYRITMVDLSMEPPAYSVFAEGWQQNEIAWGRPVDIAIADDGALLVSDDLAGAVYRIAYANTTNVGSAPKNKPGRKRVNTPSAAALEDKKLIGITGKRLTSEHRSAPSFILDRVSGTGSPSIP